jgi:hypothetical protein
MAKKQTKKTNKKVTKKIPLDELSYEKFNEMTEDEIFETYAAEIQDYGEWIWREQDRGGPTYSLEQCVEMAKQELMDGVWGPASE